MGLSKLMHYNGLAMHSNFNDLNNENMTAQYFLDTEDKMKPSSFDNQMRNWSYTESQLTAFAERYHQAKLKLLGIANVICCFNTSDKRRVRVVSGDDVFEGEVTKMEWDTDQWTYFVNGEWYCQSEINGI